MPERFWERRMRSVPGRPIRRSSHAPARSSRRQDLIYYVKAAAELATGDGGNGAPGGSVMSRNRRVDRVPDAGARHLRSLSQGWGLSHSVKEKSRRTLETGW
ncbi:hypothetical protein GCM10029978_060050 [Actinoallomurus acanthiterrae]